MKFRESETAHKYLDGLKGIEVGGSAHNPFGLNTINVDFTDDMNTIFKKAEEQICGEKLKVDVIGNGEDLQFEDNSYDFIISSHVVEHLFNPIKALMNWKRIIKDKGYILNIIPIKEFTPGETRPITTFDELYDRYIGKIKTPEELLKLEVGELEGNSCMSKDDIINILNTHHTVFDIPLYVDICRFIGLDIIEIQERDDKVGNGFLVICQK